MIPSFRSPCTTLRILVDIFTRTPTYPTKTSWCQNEGQPKDLGPLKDLTLIPWPSLWLCPSLSGLIRRCKGLVRLHKPYKALKDLRRPYKGFVRPYLEGFTTLSLRLFKEPRPWGPHSRRNGMASKHMGPRGHSDPLSMRKKAQTARPQDPCDPSSVSLVSLVSCEPGGPREPHDSPVCASAIAAHQRSASPVHRGQRLFRLSNSIRLESKRIF